MEPFRLGNWRSPDDKQPRMRPNSSESSRAEKRQTGRKSARSGVRADALVASEMTSATTGIVYSARATAIAISRK